MTYVAIFITYIFVNNFILTQFLGLCPFIGVSRNSESAIGMGMAVTFVMGIASIITYLVYTFVLVPLNLTYLQTLSFILVIAALVQFVEMIIQKNSPALYQALGIYLPNHHQLCCLGIAILNINEGYTLMQSFSAGIAGSLGFTCLVLMSNIRSDGLPSGSRFSRGSPSPLYRGGLWLSPLWPLTKHS